MEGACCQSDHELPLLWHQPVTSERIRQRLHETGQKYFSNDNIADHIHEGELDELQTEVTQKCEDLLRSLVINIDGDHNTRDTAKRVAKMFLRETFAGRYTKRPDVTAFPNVSHYDHLYIVGPVRITSTCAHHLQPITGRCWIGVFPGKEVIGLSKFQRLVDWIASRPTIQEELTHQIADIIQDVTRAEGLGVIMKAEHGCMINRGVKLHESDMVTSVLKGVMKQDDTLKKEFLQLVTSSKDF